MYLRGLAYLMNRDGRAAVAEFLKIVDHRGRVSNCSLGMLVQVQLAKAYALSGQEEKARNALQEFLKLWKDADPDIAILRQAQGEYAKLQ